MLSIFFLLLLFPFTFGLLKKKIWILFCCFRFHVESATWLSPEIKSKVLEKYSSQLTKDGWMVVKSDRTR